MNFNKTDGVLNFNDYRSFFKFIITMREIWL